MSASTSPASNRHYSYSARVEASSFFRDSPTWRPQRVIGGHLPLLAFVSYSTLFSLFFFVRLFLDYRLPTSATTFPLHAHSVPRNAALFVIYSSCCNSEDVFFQNRVSQTGICVSLSHNRLMFRTYSDGITVQRERELSHLRLHK